MTDFTFYFTSSHEQIHFTIPFYIPLFYILLQFLILHHKIHQFSQYLLQHYQENPPDYESSHGNHRSPSEARADSICSLFDDGRRSPDGRRCSSILSIEDMQRTVAAHCNLHEEVQVRPESLLDQSRSHP